MAKKLCMKLQYVMLLLNIKMNDMQLNKFFTLIFIENPVNATFLQERLHDIIWSSILYYIFGISNRMKQVKKRKLCIPCTLIHLFQS